MSTVIEDGQESGSGGGLLGLLVVGGLCAAALALHGGAPTQPATPVSMPAISSNYVSVARADAIQVGISPDLFERQIYKESSFRTNVVSPDGAIGIAQFLPATAAEHGVNPYDPGSSLLGAATWMAELSKQYGGNYDKALAAYNAGPGAVNTAVANCGESWESCLPQETQNYISDIN